LISFREVVFRYPGAASDTLQIGSLGIQEGSSVAIMGANGSGKSTAALCMNGILMPTSGDVLVDEMNTKNRPTLHEIRRRVGLVFQDPNLQFTSMTVERELAFGLENIGVPRDEMRARVNRHLNLFHLDHLKGIVPSSLSGGEKQRLAIAAIMILEPRYLLLDEATSLLSPAARSGVLQLAREMRTRNGTTLVLITQFPGEALLAERLLILHEGSIVHDEEPASVFRHAQDLSSMGIQVPLKARLALRES